MEPLGRWRQQILSCRKVESGLGAKLLLLLGRITRSKWNPKRNYNGRSKQRPPTGQKVFRGGADTYMYIHILISHVYK